MKKRKVKRIKKRNKILKAKLRAMQERINSTSYYVDNGSDLSDVIRKVKPGDMVWFTNKTSVKL